MYITLGTLGLTAVPAVSTNAVRLPLPRRHQRVRGHQRQRGLVSERPLLQHGGLLQVQLSGRLRGLGQAPPVHPRDPPGGGQRGRVVGRGGWERGTRGHRLLPTDGDTHAPDPLIAHTRTYTDTHSTDTHMRTHTHMHMHVHMHTRTYTHPRRTQTLTHARTHAPKHTHTYTHVSD